MNPCPFITEHDHHEPQIFFYGPNNLFAAVRCQCGASGPEASTYEQAIQYWNDRIRE